ncbi:Alpha/Beta hydrolase protein [Flagelloscypha sp. PMI_526]|nr:Alpha/Beta hydrolase protein [Flagelloscypha sp. PMI_526]
MSQFVRITATDGMVVNYRYNISTPTNPHATAIDFGIPTLLFIHPEYLSCEVWQNQFCSTLRRFNLVTFDLRAHGETGGRIPGSYSRIEAADDTAKFMDALNLPPAHIVGNSIGADIALQLAIAHPEKCASTTLISPIPDHEPESTTAGRKEVLDLWLESYETDDEETLGDAGWGCFQLLFNNVDTPLIRSITLALNVPRAQKIWGRDNADTLATVIYSYFTNNRSTRTRQDYACIKIPVLLVHALGDMGTPIESTQHLETVLHEAGVSVQRVTIDEAPKVAPLTHPVPVNKAIEKFVISSTSMSHLPTPKSTVSPWDEELRQVGWIPPYDLVDSEDSHEEEGIKLVGQNDQGLFRTANRFMN